MNNVAQDRLGLRQRMTGDPTIIGDPSGRMSGLAVTESGRGFQVHESPRASLGMSPQTPSISSQIDERNKFKDFLYNKYELPGKRPASKNEIANRIMSESQAKEQALSQHVFGERGREQGNREHDAAWNQALAQMRDNIKTRIMGEVSGQREDYDHKKGIIDEELKIYDSYMGKTKAGKVKKIPSKAKVLEKYQKYGGNFNYMTPIEQSIISDMVEENPELYIETTDVPAKKGWFGRVKEPARTESRLALGQEGKTAGKKLTDAEVAEILRKGKFKVTPENMRKWREQN